MALTAEQEQLEHEWRVKKMNAEILKLDQDTRKSRAELEQVLQSLKYEPWKLLATGFASGATFLAAVLALLHYVLT